MKHDMNGPADTRMMGIVHTALRSRPGARALTGGRPGPGRDSVLVEMLVRSASTAKVTCCRLRSSRSRSPTPANTSSFAIPATVVVIAALLTR